MKKLVDRLLVIYPFEKSFYDNAGIPVTYVGHPLFDEIHKEGVDEGLVTELKNNWEKPLFLFRKTAADRKSFDYYLLFLQSARYEIHRLIPSAQFLSSPATASNILTLYVLLQRIQSRLLKLFWSIHEVIKASSLSVPVTLEQATSIACYLKLTLTRNLPPICPTL